MAFTYQSDLQTPRLSWETVIHTLSGRRGTRGCMLRELLRWRYLHLKAFFFVCESDGQTDQSMQLCCCRHRWKRCPSWGRSGIRRNPTNMIWELPSWDINSKLAPSCDTPKTPGRTTAKPVWRDTPSILAARIKETKPRDKLTIQKYKHVRKQSIHYEWESDNMQNRTIPPETLNTIDKPIK